MAATPSAILRILSLVKPYRGRFVLATVFLALGSAIGLAYPKAIQYAIDEGVAQGRLEVLDKVTWLLVLLFAVQAVFSWLRHYFMSWLGERAVADIRSQVFGRLLHLSPEWFHAQRTGELVGRIAGDVTILEGVVGSDLSMALRNLVQLLGGLGLLAYTDKWLTVAMLLVVPPMTIGVMLFGRRIRKMSKALQDAAAVTNGRVQEVLGAIVTVQAFAQEDREARNYRTGIENVFNRSLDLARWRSTFYATSTFAGFAAMAFVVWLGGRRVAEGAIRSGELTAFMLYTMMVAMALGSLTGLWSALQRAAGATQRLYEIIDTKSQIASPANPQEFATDARQIELEDVSFAYPGRPDVEVLRNVSLRVKPGETVALVGPSGAGKTTLTALVPRFYDAIQGSVSVGGVDVKELDLETLRRAIAIVPQDPVLFGESIAENVAYAKPGASSEEIEEACRKANAHGFITGFPEGYATICGERGVQLSGGQRQRVAIARAILADPQILILDEATSSLDAESEAAIQVALQDLMKGRTTLIIAHRLSTVKEADRILVVDGGTIVEEGTHSELLAQEGMYRKLLEHQLSSSR